MLTGIAAVPASTSRSPHLSVTIYSPNQSSPEPGIPGQASSATITSISLCSGTPLASSLISRGRRSRSVTGRRICGACGAGRYRVFYTIDEEGQAVQIDHVARVP